MKNKTLFIVVLVGMLGVALYLRSSTKRGIIKSRQREIALMTEDIAKLKSSLESRGDEALSNRDLSNALEIQRLEGDVRKLRMETAFSLSLNDKDMFPDWIRFFFLVFISMQVGALEKKLNSKESTINT